MELKYRYIVPTAIPKLSFNCTFMELKYGVILQYQFGITSFNCTFMELKLELKRLIIFCCSVLIVPLWN